MTYDDVLGLLNGVRKRQGYVVARCPAHQDRHQSLSVKEGTGGVVLLRCHAGCSFDEIVRGLGVSAAELMGEDKDESVPSDPEKVYVYTDEAGIVLFESVRLPGKKFRQRHKVGGEYVWGLGDRRRVLYQLPKVLEAAQAGERIFITEGEKDADAVTERGVLGTCNPMGAGKWQDEYTECFRGCGIAVVVVDKDEPGRKHAQKVRDSFKAAGIPVKLVQAKKGKDAFDHLVTHGLKFKEFVDVREGRMAGVVTSSQMADNALRALEECQDTKKFYPNPWAVPGIEWVPGRMYMIGGWTGSGKSAAIGQVYRHLAEGGVRVGLITNEMPEADFRNRILCHKGFKLEALEKPWDMSELEKRRLVAEIEVMRLWNSDIIFDTAAGAKQAGEYLSDGGYEVLLFDHISRTDSATRGEEAAIAREIAGFTNLALDNSIPVLVVGQLKNPPNGMVRPRPTIHDFKGSGAIGQEAAMAIAMWRQSNADAAAELIVLKNRHGRSDFTEYLNYVGAQYRFELKPKGDTVGVSWR